MHARTKISFLVVNYKSKDVLKKCLHDLEAVCEEKDYEILVANNDTDTLSINSENVTVFEGGINEGFGKAHNKIANHANGEVLCILNPDTYNFSQNFCQLADLLTDKSIGIVAPQVLTPGGELQLWSVGKEVSPFRVIFDNVFSPAKEKPRSEKIGWVTGAAFMIRKADFLEVAGFDENFFLYFEDVDLCRRIKSRGLQIVHADDYFVTHIAGESVESTTKQKSQYYTAQDQYFQKYYGKTIAKIMTLLRRLTH